MASRTVDDRPSASARSPLSNVLPATEAHGHFYVAPGKRRVVVLRRPVGDDFQQLAQAAAEDHADSLQRGEVYTGRPVARQSAHRAAVDMRPLRQFGGFQLVALHEFAEVGTDHGM